MVLRAVGGMFTENLADEFFAQTSMAILDVDKIVHDKEKRQVLIPIARYPVIQREKALRRVLPYKQDRNRKISCLVTVNNVVDLKMRTHFEEEWKNTISIHMGISVSDEEIYLCSNEEMQGKHFFDLNIETDSLDIELRDI